MQLMCELMLLFLVLHIICGVAFSQRLNQLCTSSQDRIGRCVKREHCPAVIENSNNSNDSICRSGESQHRETLICCPILRNCGHCGEPEQEIVNRITGGSDVEPGSHPWAALLVYTLGRGVTKSLCGGALINLQTVLTAAHCIEGLPRNWRMHRVRLGEWNVDNLHSCKNIENGEICNLELEVRRTILHDHYNRLSNSHLNDIALLQLAEKVTISKYIKPICLPLDKTIQLMPIENEPFTVVGWGETENGYNSPTLLEVTVIGKHLSMCNQVFRKQNMALTETQLCVGGEEGKDSCRGDSGGPLMRQIDNTWYLVGMVSFGDRICGVRNQPSVYTNVVAYIDWIEHQIIEYN